MDLNKLRTFTIVAENQSISKAAMQLYRTQPAISHQLKDLEQELDLNLFERKNARIYLTKEGQALYRDAKYHLQQLDDAVLRLRGDNKTAEGLIRIAVDVDSISYLLPKIIKEFKLEFPKVRFEILTAQFGDIDDLLIHNQVDFALMVIYSKGDFFEKEPFFSYTRSLVASPDYLATVPPVNKIKDLLNLNLIGFYSELGDIRMWLKKNGYSRHISTFEKQAVSLVVNDAYTLNEMIFSGVGAGLCFDNMAGQRAFESQQLVALFPEAEPIFAGVDIAYKKVRNKRYINEAFKEFVVSNKDHWRNWHSTMVYTP